MDKQIGQRLREMRLKAKLSQAKVAAVVGSRQSAVARFESGEAHVPADVMVGYADYFDVSLDYIFGRTDNPHGTHYEGKVKIEKAYKDGTKTITLDDVKRAIKKNNTGSDLDCHGAPNRKEGLCPSFLFGKKKRTRTHLNASVRWTVACRWSRRQHGH